MLFSNNDILLTRLSIKIYEVIEEELALNGLPIFSSRGNTGIILATIPRGPSKDQFCIASILLTKPLRWRRCLSRNANGDRRTHTDQNMSP
jgi:hypothetical protein